MQVPNAIVFVAAEIIIVLLVCTVVFFVHSRKLKSLVRRQQEKLLARLEPQPNTPEKIAPAAQAQSYRSYKSYLTEELDATAAQFSADSPDYDIALELPENSPQLLRILALRYAFLRAEELGTTADRGTTEYWSIFQQALEPLLTPTQGRDNPETEAELATAKKRIENLEKFQRLFFDMEKQWEGAQANAQNYYTQILALSEGVHDRDAFNSVLENYHGVYDSIQKNITQVIQNPDSFGRHIHITRQDPLAADEIVKLRNVAADQHRIINDLQKKLVSATTTEEKEHVVLELQHQLQRQIRFAKESETCIKLLEDELEKAHDEIFIQKKKLTETSALSEENQEIKKALHNFTRESKDLLSHIHELENENNSLKQHMRKATSKPATAELTADARKTQLELSDLKKQYSELEEKYLDLKLSNR